MKAALVLLLLASPAFAQDKVTDTAVAPGCGADDSKYDVTIDKTQHPLTQPDAGKALVVFIEDDSDFGSRPKPTTRAGLDGGWVGATHGNSYLYFSVDPGEHHLCASWQKAVIVRQGHKTAATHFTAEAGKVYYFRVRNSWHREHGTALIDFTPLDSDEGLLLASRFALSTSHPKKS
jgi:hypothetical protein